MTCEKLHHMCDKSPDSETPSGHSGGSASPERVAALVENHRAFLSFVERRVGNRAVAEDILQEAFVRGLGRVETLRSDDSVVAWFYRTLRNAIVDHRRRSGAAQRALGAFGAEVEQAELPLDEFRAAACQCINRLATTLKPEFADALRHIEVEGLAVKDYASLAGISKSNAAVRVFRAREALRKEVAASCGTCAKHGCLSGCTCITAPL